MDALRYSPGYQPQAGFRPGSLTLTLLIGGALVSAMFFISPTFRPAPDTPFTGTNIPLDPPPPPDPQPKPQPRHVAQRDIYVPPTPLPPPRLDTAPKIDVIATPPPRDDVAGSGTTTASADPPKAAVLTGAEIDKRFAGSFQPLYPADEIRAGNEGRVTVRVLIGADGRVKQIERVAAASESFFAATRRRALTAWRFTPATRDGVACESWKTLSVSFVLDQR